MKHLLFLLMAIALFACSTDQEQSVQTQLTLQPKWLDEKIHAPVIETIADLNLEAADFMVVQNDSQANVLATDIQSCMRAIERDIPLDLCEKLIDPTTPMSELRSIKERFFYSRNRSEEFIRTRTVVNNIQVNYSTPGIYFHLITNLGQALPSGPQEAINYFTLGTSANTITFGDINRAGRALYNQNAINVLSFDPNLADFHYYQGTSNPVLYSGWSYEMVYEDPITFSGVQYNGPFGSQDGSNANYAYQFITPYNETFTEINGETWPDFPLYDALWYFPINGLGAVYVLGSDL